MKVVLLDFSKGNSTFSAHPQAMMKLPGKSADRLFFSCNSAYAGNEHIIQHGNYYILNNRFFQSLQIQEDQPQVPEPVVAVEDVEGKIIVVD